MVGGSLPIGFEPEAAQTSAADMRSQDARRRRWWVRLATGCSAGVLVALSLPPFGWWPLAWAGLGILAFGLASTGLWQRVVVGAGFGLGQYFIGLWWVHEFSVPGYLALVVLSSLFAAAALAAVPASRYRYVAFALPSALLITEWVRDRYPLGGFPLGGSALGQASGPLAPALRIGGGLLLVGNLALVGTALAGAALVARELRGRQGIAMPSPTKRDLIRRSSGCVALLISAAALPLAGRLSPDGSGGSLPALRVALVQGGGPRGTRAIYTDPEVVFQRHLEASAYLRPPLDLVVWPEGVLQSHFDFTTTGDAQAVAGLATRLSATVLVGVEQDVGVRHYFNEVVAWGPDGTIRASYRKNHLVPFGEYVPYRSLIETFFNIVDVPYDGIPGHGPGFVATPAGPLGVMISYEVFFDGRARGAVRAGGQILVVPTNTASYRSTQVPTQEVAAARLRAWETGRWVVQVTPTGYTAVISPDGKVEDRTKLGEQAIVYASVPKETGKTVYVDIGDTPFAALSAAGLAFTWVLELRQRKLRRSSARVLEG
jgi:apolipoprotein N-acyltransferase